jgi:hypothetical protein
MTEQIIGAELVKPAAENGTPGAVLRDTNAARGLPPSTRLNRNSKIEYAMPTAPTKECAACSSTIALTASP